MPQGDKSVYTGKQKHKAEHFEEGYEVAAYPRTKPNAALGPPSTRKAAAAGSPAPAVDTPKTMPSPQKADARWRAAASRTKEERSASAIKARAICKRNEPHPHH
jgi:hypothetical protein